LAILGMRAIHLILMKYDNIQSENKTEPGSEWSLYDFQVLAYMLLNCLAFKSFDYERT